MRVVFRGDPVELERGQGLSRTSLDLWGVHFPMNVAVDVSHLDADMQRRLSRNPHFQVVADEAPVATPAPVVEVAPAVEVEVEAQAEEVAETTDEADAEPAKPTAKKGKR